MGFRVAAAGGGHHHSAGRTRTRLANLILAPKEEAKRLAAYLGESKAWAAKALCLIDRRAGADRAAQTIAKHGQRKEYIITIADDDRRRLDNRARNSPPLTSAVT